MKSAVLKKWTSRPGELAWPSPVLVTLCYALKCHIWSYSAAENSRNRKEGLSPNTGAGVLSFRTQKWSGGYVKTTPTGKRFVGPWLGSAVDVIIERKLPCSFTISFQLHTPCARVPPFVPEQEKERKKKTGRPAPLPDLRSGISAGLHAHEVK